MEENILCVEENSKYDEAEPSHFEISLKEAETSDSHKDG